MKKNKVYRNALIAVTIGDGHIDKNGYGLICHSKAQKEYLEWKHSYLKSIGVKVLPIRYRDNNGYGAYLFGISTCRFTKLLRRIMYTPTKNYYSRKLLNRLEAIHIAIWYMDDGGLSQKKRNGKVYANELTLNTYTSKENNQILIDYFKDVWNINFNQYRNKGKYRLSCSTKEARKFISIVYPYVSKIECMKHKLNVKPLTISKGSTPK